MVIDNLKLILVHIPRTGGTSIESAFNAKLCDTSPPDHIITEIGYDKWKSYFKIAIVRNPFDRLVSLYFFQELLKIYNITNIINNNTSRVTSPSRSFTDYANAVYMHSRVVQGDIPDTQTSWLCAGGPFAHHPSLMADHKPGDLVVDQVLRFETLSQDFDTLKQSWGLNELQLPKLNTSIHDDYRSYYSDIEKSQISQVYSSDLKKFNYSF